MKTYGLLGNPLSQSFSQKYFSEKFQSQGIQARYLNFELPTIDELPNLLTQHAYISGLSVTIPYKEQVFKYLDELSEDAAKIGAVNCIKITWEDNKPHLKGYNTDVIGFSKSISPFLKPHHKKALILGTGGSSKAVAYAFSVLGIDYKFVSRQPKSSDEFGYNELNAAVLNEYSIIVNTTPVGMFPKIDICPNIPYELVSKNHLFFDLTYNPMNTLFMLNGQKYGAVTKNGLDMLHIQAEEAWAIWNEGV